MTKKSTAHLGQNGPNPPRDLKQFKADNLKRAQENGGVSVVSLTGFTPEEIVKLLYPD